MFMGEYNHTLDQKGRLSIPSKYRGKLGEEFVISKGMDGCLFAYSEEEWEEFTAKISELSTVKKEARNFVRLFLSGASEVTIDKQGRIILPKTLQEYANIEKDVVIIGAGKRFEIWSAQKWNETMGNSSLDEASEALVELGFDL